MPIRKDWYRMAKRGRPRKVQEPQGTDQPQVPSIQQKEEKLIDLDTLDRSIDAKNEELAKLDELIRSKQFSMDSLDSEIEAKRRFIQDELRSEKELELERIRQVKDKLDVQEKHFQELENQFSARNAELELKEIAAARFEEERKKFGDFSIQIEQMRMKAVDVMEKALQIRGDYEARLRDFQQSSLEFEQEKKRQDEQRDYLNQLAGTLERAHKEFSIERKVFEEARRALNAKAMEKVA